MNVPTYVFFPHHVNRKTAIIFKGRFAFIFNDIFIHEKLTFNTLDAGLTSAVYSLKNFIKIMHYHVCMKYIHVSFVTNLLEGNCNLHWYINFHKNRKYIYCFQDFQFNAVEYFKYMHDMYISILSVKHITMKF